MPKASLRKIMAISHLFAFVSISLQGCTALPGGAKVFPGNSMDEGTEIAGIANDPGDVFLLYVHGMGRTEKNFSEDLIASGSKLLARSSAIEDKNFGDGTCGENCRTINLPEPVYVRGEGMTCTPSVPETDACRISTFGELRKSIIEAEAATINVYSFYWDDAAAQIQSRYSYTDASLDGDAYRPSINRNLKESVVTYGFSDAAIYLGPFGKVMRSGLESSLCIMVSDALAKSIGSTCMLSDLTESDRRQISSLKTVFAAKSLGSRYLFDTLMPSDQIDLLVEAPDIDDESEAIATIEAKKAIGASMSNFYLLANQLPLLGLGRVQIGSPESIARRDAIYCRLIAPLDGDCEFAGLGESEEIQRYHGIFEFAGDSRAEFGLDPRVITVYAFHDPSDLLGFKAGYHFVKNAKRNVRFVEISHRNTSQLLWLFGSPKAAHAKEDRSKTASQIIWCGATVGTSGRLKAKDCP